MDYCQTKETVKESHLAGRADGTVPGPGETGFRRAGTEGEVVGDMTEFPTGEGKLYLSIVIDLFSRRLLGYATAAHPDTELAGQTIKMALTARGGQDRVAG